MMAKLWSRLLVGSLSAEPLGPVPAVLRPLMSGLALLLRLFVAGLTGIVAAWLGREETLVVGVTGFVPYGYDKLLGGNVNYAMDASFFRAIGMPVPELTAVLIGVLELFGGLAILAAS